MFPADYQLVLRARDGDEWAFGELLRRHNDVLHAVARRYYLRGGENDDVLQAGRIGLLNAVRDYNPHAGATFRVFAGMTITREIITAVKTASRQKHEMLNSAARLEQQEFSESDEPVELGHLLAEPRPGPLEQAITRENLQQITTAVQHRLSPVEHAALAGRLNGHTQQQTADTLNVPLKTIDNALQRVRAKLTREQLAHAA